MTDFQAVLVFGPAMIFVGACLVCIFRQKTDSLARIVGDMSKVESRFGKLATRRQAKVDSGIKEITLLEEHLNETKNRVVANNIEHQAIISATKVVSSALVAAINTLDKNSK